MRSPIDMPLVRSGRIDLHYESYGEGAPVVFLHGLHGNTLSWFQQVPELSAWFRCVLVDMRGCKHSICRPEDAHPRSFVDDIRAILDAEKIERAAFACHGLGAWAGLPLAVRHPERVACLALSGSSNPAYSPEAWAIVQREIAQAGARGDTPAFSPRFAKDRPDLVRLHTSIGRLNGSRNIAALGEDECKLHPEQFVGFAVPTLLMRGSEDPLVSAEALTAAAALVPGAKAFTFEGCGDSPYFERPPLYNRVLHSFFRQSNWGR